MADEYDDLDVAALEAKLAEATSYEERATLRKALRARKKQRGESTAAVRRGASSYNRFRTSTTTAKQQQYIPPAAAAAAGGGERKLQTVTPARSNTPSSSASPTPLSPAPQSISPLPPSPQLKSPLHEEEQGDEKEEVVEEQVAEVVEVEEEHPQAATDLQSEEGELVDKTQTGELKQEATKIKAQTATRRQEQTDGGSPFGVQLRSRDGTKTAAAPSPSSPAKADQSKAEFQGFKLRKTPSQSKDVKQPANKQRTTSHHSATPAAEKTSNPKEHEYLVLYVNSTLQLNISVDGSELYDTCCNPRTICKLINQSVRNTVDMRALTKTPPPSKVADLEEALQENMTLAVESARAIGCAIDDDTEEKLLKKDHETFRRLLVDLIKARLVHKPGMEDAPSSTFSNLPLMMEKLNLSPGDNSVDGEEDKDEEPRQWREMDSDALRSEVEANEDTPAPSTSSWRETAETSDSKPSVDLTKSTMDDNISYEERAALRRAERERRRKEREALATAK